MSCKNCQCSVTEEIKQQPKVSCQVSFIKGPTINVVVKEETLKRIQSCAPNVSLNELLAEIIETFDYEN